MQNFVIAPLGHEGARMRRIFSKIIILLTICCLAASSEPKNVLVDGYTFTRPERWTWEAPSGPPTYLNRFNVPGKSGPAVTYVGFYQVSSLRRELHKRVLSNFDRSARLTEIKVKIAHGELIYVKVLGTANARGTTPKQPDYELFGVLLPEKTEEKGLFVRIFGPAAEVDDAIADFKTMVEKAVEEGAE